MGPHWQAILCLQLDQIKNQTELDFKGHCASEHGGRWRLYQGTQCEKWWQREKHLGTQAGGNGYPWSSLENCVPRQIWAIPWGSDLVGKEFGGSQSRQSWEAKVKRNIYLPLLWTLIIILNPRLLCPMLHKKSMRHHSSEQKSLQLCWKSNCFHF